MKNSLKLASVALLALTAITASAVTDTMLKIGDPAPKLQNGKWVQGDPVKSFEPGKAYVVEFWATWCGPCRQSIPHLNDVYKKYQNKGLVVIGQDCWETDETKVAPFVKEMGDKMTYRVALDDKTQNEKGAMAKTWMEAAGRNGIPSAFLVNTKGVIAWIGHPMELEKNEDVIDQVLAGTYDVQKAAIAYDKEIKEQEAERKASAPFNEKLGAASKAMKEKKWDAAMDDLAAAETVAPAKNRELMILNLNLMRMRVQLGKGDTAEAIKLASKMGDENKDENDKAGLLNYLAITLVNEKSMTKEGLQVAQKLADRANDLTNGKDAHILRTQARVQFALGDKDTAIKTQSLALDRATDKERAAFQTTLDGYKHGEAPMN